MNCIRLKVKEDIIAELHGNVLKKDEEIASLRSQLDEQTNKNNVRSSIFLPSIGNVILKLLFGFQQSMHTISNDSRHRHLLNDIKFVLSFGKRWQSQPSTPTVNVHF